MNKLIVVIPALNEQNLIKETLTSLNNQTNTSFSVIVVDNGSTDQTVGVATEFSKSSKYQLQIVSEPKLGVGYARNTGSLKAMELGAVYIASTDADTTFPTNWIESIYKGFKNQNTVLVCGESDPTKRLSFSNKKMEFVTNARSVLFHKVKPYFRGVNYAVTSEMLNKIGGIKQPLTLEGKPAPGEDGRLELDVLAKGEVPHGCLATVFPHPRRYISTAIQIQGHLGSIHKDGVVTQVRNEKELELNLASIPQKDVESLANKMLEYLFIEHIVHIYKDPLYRKTYWINASKMLKPFVSTEIEKDVIRLKNTELWKKYKEAFTLNLKKYMVTEV